VDYSEKSGADGVVIFANPWFTPADRTKTHWNALRPTKRKDGKAAITFVDVNVKGTPMFVMLMHEGDAPQATVDGDSLRIGERVYRFNGIVISFAER
jgi:hypothetical protein